MNEITNMQSETIEAKELNVEDYLQVTEDIIRKQYLARLTDFRVADPRSDSNYLSLEDDLIDNVRLYKVSEMVYQKGEPITEKFTTVFNALATYKSSLFIVLDFELI